MSRHRTLAIALFAALPTAAHGQATIKDLLDAKSRSSPASWSDGWEMSDWNAYNRAGWRAINKGAYGTAEREFRSAIQVALRRGVDNPRLAARSYADYAWALQKQGRNAEAEPHLKWALLARKAALEPTSSAIAQTQNQLATLYYDLGRYTDAEALLYQAIDSQFTAPKPNSQEFARSETLMGLVMSAQRRYAEAEPHFSKAVTLREKAQGPSHPDTGDCLNNLAWAYLEQGKDDEAKPLFDRALRIFERARGDSDPSVAHLVDGLGQILRRQHQPKEAEDNYLRAIAIWEKLPAEGLSLLEVLRHYADLLEDEGRSADLDKVKARIAPLRAKYTLARLGLGSWYRFPDPSPGLGAPATAPTPPRIPG
jgi:tetratricopeptide (TPR) repeat protein